MIRKLNVKGNKYDMLNYVERLQEAVNKIRFLERQIGSCESFLIYCKNDEAQAVFEPLVLRYREDLEDTIELYRCYVDELKAIAADELLERDMKRLGMDDETEADELNDFFK